MVALHTNYMTQITLRFKTSEHDSLPLVQHSSMKSSQSETLTHSVSPGPGVYIQYTYSGVQTIEDVLLTCPSSISGNCQVFHFTSYPCTCTSEHVKQGQMIQFWSFSTSRLIIAEHSKVEPRLVIVR